MNYSKKIKMIRESLGLSLGEIGKYLDLSGPHVLRLEQEKTEISSAVLQKYIDVFGVDPEWIYAESDEEDSKSSTTVRFLERKIDGSKTVADRVHELRTEYGMTQHGFAEYTSVAQPIINRIESGKTNPGVQTLKKIAAACHVGVEWLQFGDENRKMYPVDDRLIEYLWKHENMREMIYHYMDEDSGKE